MMYVMIDTYVIVILFAIVLVMIFFYHLNNKYHKHNKFKNYINIITAVGTFILAIGIISNVITYQDERKKFKSQTINSFAKDFTGSIISIFMEHPEMNYFYEEIFLNRVKLHQKRNVILEEQICLTIFTKFVEQLAIIDIYRDHPESKNINNVLKNYSKKLFKIPRIRSYYTNLFKPNFGGPIMSTFMQTNFGL